MKVLLISTYELGRQPFGLASPAAWLRAAGFDVGCCDASRTPLREDVVRAASLVAFYLPMHTATRLALPAIRRVREWNPDARLCCYGLYAPPNAGLLKSIGVEAVFGAEFEPDLVALAQSVAAKTDRSSCRAPGSTIPRLRFLVPDRRDLPPLGRYAKLHIDGEQRIVGYTEASRGCKHLCRHCPVVPIYQGAFRIVSPDIVLADIRAQVAAGARHITFGDPDFFNSVRHALQVVRALARELPGVTYDVTIKIEHLLRHAADLGVLRDTGCLFITSAAESLDDRVLALLEKHHTRADFVRAVELCQGAGLALSPTFVAFHPWLTLEGYCDLLDTIDRLDLIEHVAPIQLAIRLLIPEGSRLLELPEIRQRVEPYDPSTLAYPWRHDDARVDALQAEVSELVGRRPDAPRPLVFEAARRLAYARAGVEARPREADRDRIDRAAIPYLSEPWYC